MKRLRALVAAALLIVGMTFTAAPTSAYYYECQDVISQNYFAGWTATNTFRGVMAYIDVYSTATFGPCSNNWGNDGASAWVSVSPVGGNTSQLIQIGLIRCNQVSNGCDATHFRYFVAEGGCNGDQPYPQIVGNATDPVAHKYWIDRGTGASAGWWYAYVDSTLMAQWAPNDSRISCWIGGTGNKEINYLAETWDRGDNIGNPQGGETWFTTMRYKSSSDNWANFNIGSGVACNSHDIGFGCDITSAQAMKVWKP